MPGNEIKEMEGQNPTGLRSRQEFDEKFCVISKQNLTENFVEVI